MISDDLFDLMITRSMVEHVLDKLSASAAGYQAKGQDNTSAKLLRAEGFVAEAGALLEDIIYEERKAEQSQEGQE